jgi:hypothetical protein
VSDPTRKKTLLSAVETAQSTGCHFNAPDPARLPRGAVAEPGREHLLRRKSVIVRSRHNSAVPEWVVGPKAVSQWHKVIAALQPRVCWLKPMAGSFD